MNIHHVALMYFGKASGEFKKDEVEVSKIEWFSLNDALKMKLAFNHNEVLERYSANCI